MIERDIPLLDIVSLSANPEIRLGILGERGEAKLLGTGDKIDGAIVIVWVSARSGISVGLESVVFFTEEGVRVSCGDCLGYLEGLTVGRGGRSGSAEVSPEKQRQQLTIQEK